MTDHGAWEVVHVLHSRADNGTGAVVCQLGDAVSGEVSDSEAPAFAGSWGILSLAAPPAPGVGAAEAVVLKHQGGDIIVGGRSLRSASIAGLVKMGETCVYADGSEAVMLFKTNGGAYVMTTHDNTKSGKNVYFAVEPMLDGSKGSFGGFRMEAPWGFLRNDPNGLSYVHTPSGVSFDFGAASFSGPFAPLSAFSGYASITAPLIRLNGSAIALGTDAGVPEPIGKALSIIGWMTAVETALAALAVAIDLKAVQAPVPVAPGPVTSAMTTAIGNLQAFKAALTSKSTTVT